VLTAAVFHFDVAIRLQVAELARLLFYADASRRPRTVSPSSFSEGWRVTNTPAGRHRYFFFQSSVLLNDWSDTQPTWNQKANNWITSPIISTSWGQQPNNMGAIISTVTPCCTKVTSTCVYARQSEVTLLRWEVIIFFGQYHYIVPSQAWSDPEGSRKLRFPDFMTTA